MKDNQKIFGENFIEIKYEKLLINPRYEIKKILSKLELEFEEQMFEFMNHANEIVKNHELSWKKNLFKPIMKGNIDSWKIQLSTEIVCKIEKSLFDEMKIGGYCYRSKSKVLSTFFYYLSMIYKLKNCH